MAVYSNSTLIPDVLPGLAHRTLAGPEHGLKGLEIWSQSIDAQGATPPHRHDCEEVVIVLEGEGTLAMSGQEMHFAAGDTVIIPRNEVHQIFNTGLPSQFENYAKLVKLYGAKGGVGSIWTRNGTLPKVAVAGRGISYDEPGKGHPLVLVSGLNGLGHYSGPQVTVCNSRHRPTQAAVMLDGRLPAKTGRFPKTSCQR